MSAVVQPLPEEQMLLENHFHLQDLTSREQTRAIRAAFAPASPSVPALLCSCHGQSCCIFSVPKHAETVLASIWIAWFVQVEPWLCPGRAGGGTEPGKESGKAQG